MEVEFSTALGKPLHLRKVSSVIRNGTAATVTRGEDYLPYKEQVNKLGLLHLKAMSNSYLQILNVMERLDGEKLFFASSITSMNRY